MLASRHHHACSAVGHAVAVRVDLLLAHLFGDLLLLGHRLGVEAHALHRHGLLLHHGALLVQHDLVLLLGDRRAVKRLAAVGVRDRLALDPDLLALHRDGDRLLLGDDVLAQARATALAGLGAHMQLLLGAGHGVVRGRPGGVVTHRAGLVAGCQAALGAHAGGAHAGRADAGRARIGGAVAVGAGIRRPRVARGVAGAHVAVRRGETVVAVQLLLLVV